MTSIALCTSAEQTLKILRQAASKAAKDRFYIPCRRGGKNNFDTKMVDRKSDKVCWYFLSKQFQLICAPSVRFCGVRKSWCLIFFTTASPALLLQGIVTRDFIGRISEFFVVGSCGRSLKLLRGTSKLYPTSCSPSSNISTYSYIGDIALLRHSLIEYYHACI